MTVADGGKAGKVFVDMAAEAFKSLDEIEAGGAESHGSFSLHNSTLSVELCKEKLPCDSAPPASISSSDLKASAAISTKTLPALPPSATVIACSTGSHSRPA